MTNKNDIKKIIPLILVAFILGLVFWQIYKRANNQPVTVDSGRMMIMGTLARIQIQADTSEQGSQALKNAVEALHHFDRQLSTFREDSEMSKINRQAADEPVAVSDLTFFVLQRAIEYGKLTNSAFDITVTPLLKLWKQAAKENRLPTSAEIAEAKKYVGWEKVELTTNPQTVHFAEKGVKLTVHAIAEGYAVDYAMSALKIPGVRAALIDLGGEVSCFGGPWIIGIQDPFVKDNDNQLSQHPRWRLRCKDISVSTSGNYRHFVTIGGRHYSHIVDPRTGEPAKKLPSVTVIAPKTMDADALATSISVMGVEEGLKLAQSLPGVEALLVAGTADEPKFYRTKGFSQYEIPSE